MAEEVNPETKKMVNPRVEIDTSAPFGSVEEAVTHFERKGSWVPHHLLQLTQNHNEDCDFDKVEKQATQLEKDLLDKERETLGVLQELENTKKFIDSLKLKLIKDGPECMGTPEITSLCPTLSPGLILMELNHAKLNLNRSTNDLSLIKSSVESLNKKVKKEKNPNEEPLAKDINVFKELRIVNFEVEQLKNITQAAQYEMMKAMLEIEQTKNSINMVEMRLTAARKMEEAARAVEAVAFAEIKASKKSNDVTLPFEEYSCLTQKAQLIESISEKRFKMKSNEYNGENEGIEATKHNEMRENARRPMFKFKTPNPIYGNRDFKPFNGIDPDLVEEKTVPVTRSTISIGDILSRKLILQDDFVVGSHVETHSKRQQVSLSQMLRDQSGLILQPKKCVKERIVHKQLFSHKKRFGFIDILLPRTRQSKKSSNSQ